MAPNITPSGEQDMSFMGFSAERVSDWFARVGDGAFVYAAPAVAPPDMVVDGFLRLDPASVVEPHPR